MHGFQVGRIAPEIPVVIQAFLNSHLSSALAGLELLLGVSACEKCSPMVHAGRGTA
jgi:hypothetical protein